MKWFVLMIAVHFFAPQWEAFADDLPDQYCKSKKSTNPYVVELYSYGAKAYLESVKAQRSEILAEFFCSEQEGQMNGGSKIIRECYQKGENVTRHLIFTQKRNRLKVTVYSTESESDLVPLMTLRCSNASLNKLKHMKRTQREGIYEVSQK